MAQSAATGRGSLRSTRFALTKFRPPALPAMLITRPALHGRLTEGADQRLTVVVGSAGAGKSVLLADWAAARPPGVTSWLSCDGADADPVRFWAAFIEAPRAIEPGFGADAADLLAMDMRMSADVIASVANDAAGLPAGSAIVVDDFHYAAAAVAAPHMTDLVERWPSEAVQLVLASRYDPPLRQHRLRMSGQLTEIRDRDLYFSVGESRDLLTKFGVQMSDADLALLHQRSEGWPAVLQMAALSLRGTTDPARLARAIEVRGTAIADYFISEVLEQQPPEVAQFMLDTSILVGVLTADACAAVTGRQDAAALLHTIDTAHLFLVVLDDDRTSFRYHRLVRQVLRAELRARDRAREQELQLRAAEWFEATGDARRAAHHFLAVQQADRALLLLQDQVVPDFLHAPTVPEPLALDLVDPSLLLQTPERLLGLAADLLLSGDTARGGEYLDLLKHAGKIPAGSRLAARFAAFQSFRYGVIGQPEMAVRMAGAARAIQEQTQLADDWNAIVPLVLIRVYNCLDDFPAAEREAAAALAAPTVTEPARLLIVPGSRALAWFKAGRLAEAAHAARAGALLAGGRVRPPGGDDRLQVGPAREQLIGESGFTRAGAQQRLGERNERRVLGLGGRRAQELRPGIGGQSTRPAHGLEDFLGTPACGTRADAPDSLELLPRRRFALGDLHQRDVREDTLHRPVRLRRGSLAPVHQLPSDRPRRGTEACDAGQAGEDCLGLALVA